MSKVDVPRLTIEGGPATMAEVLLALPSVRTVLRLRLRLTLVGGWLSYFLGASQAFAQEVPLTAAELKQVEARVAPVVPTAASFRLQAGDTILVEDSLLVPRNRLRRIATDYEAVMSAAGGSDGLRIHRRADRMRWVERGNNIEVIFTYAIDVAPGRRRGGPVQATLELRERKGLGNTVARKRVRHQIVVTPMKAKTRELAADFRAYRYYLPRARRRLSVLQRAGLRKLSLEDEAAVPSAQRLNTNGVRQLRSFERERRRAWAGHRHLVAATRSGQPKLEREGRAFLKNLAKPASGWSSDLPSLALAEAPVVKAPELSSEGDGGTLAPVAEFVPGSEGSVRPEPLPEPTPPPPEPERPALPTTGPAEASKDTDEDAFDETLAETMGVGLEPVPVNPSEASRVGRRFYLPSYTRSLVLDDPNIAHAGAVRMSLAQVTSPEEASAMALFYFAQVGLTEDVGLEVTVPTQLVSLQVGGLDQSLYRLGNPLLAGKYRIHLPLIGERRPALTLRARWGIAATQRNPVPAAADLFLETFSEEANFTDLYAFRLEQTNLGLGASLAWQQGLFVVSTQLYFDYFIPTEIATFRRNSLAISYAASLGVQPFGEILTGFVEARAVSLLTGSARTEMVGYLGLRSRLFDMFEPALWVGVPVGSTANVTSLQFGAELRMSYDLRDIVEFGGRRQVSSGN